jgi:ParB-like chromosome segregation protein Spo0J
MAKPKNSDSPATEPPHDPEASGREPAAFWVPIDELMPWVKNPRKNDEAVDAVAASIKRFGFGNPLLARKANGEIIGGHTRLKAAKKIGLETVPVRYLDLDPAEAHLLAIADNKLGEIADWDGSLLLEALSQFGLDDVAVAGFDQAELDKLAEALVGPDPTDPPSDADGETSGAGHTCPKCGHTF